MSAITRNSSSLEIYHATCAIYVTIPQPSESLRMTTAQVVETSVTVKNNSPIQYYTFTRTIKLNLLLKLPSLILIKSSHE